MAQPQELVSPLALEQVPREQGLPLFQGWELEEWVAPPQALVLRPEQEQGVRGQGVDASYLDRQPATRTYAKSSALNAVLSPVGWLDPSMYPIVEGLVNAMAAMKPRVLAWRSATPSAGREFLCPRC